MGGSETFMGLLIPILAILMPVFIVGIVILVQSARKGAANPSRPAPPRPAAPAEDERAGAGNREDQGGPAVRRGLKPPASGGEELTWSRPTRNIQNGESV